MAPIVKNACEQVKIGFGFTSGWLIKRREIFLSVSKIKQTFLISVIMKYVSGSYVVLKIIARALRVCARAVTGVAHIHSQSLTHAHAQLKK